MCPHTKLVRMGLQDFSCSPETSQACLEDPSWYERSPDEFNVSQQWQNMAKHHAPWFHFSDTSVLMFLLKWRVEKNAVIPNTGKHIAKTSHRDPTKHAGSLYQVYPHSVSCFHNMASVPLVRPQTLRGVRTLQRSPNWTWLHHPLTMMTSINMQHVTATTPYRKCCFS